MASNVPHTFSAGPSLIPAQATAQTTAAAATQATASPAVQGAPAGQPALYGPNEFLKHDSLTLRMIGHDLFDNGKMDMSFVWNPENAAPFLSDAEAYESLKYHYYNDIYDDRIINGSSLLRDLSFRIMPLTTGQQRWDFWQQGYFNLTPVDLNASQRPIPPMDTEAGINQLAAQSGISPKEFAALTYWSHDLIGDAAVNNMYRNPITGQYVNMIQDNLNNPRALDFGFTHAHPQILNYANQINSSANPAAVFGADFGNLMNRLILTRR